MLERSTFSVRDILHLAGRSDDDRTVREDKRLRSMLDDLRDVHATAPSATRGPRLTPEQVGFVKHVLPVIIARRSQWASVDAVMAVHGLSPDTVLVATTHTVGSKFHDNHWD